MFKKFVTIFVLFMTFLSTDSLVNPCLRYSNKEDTKFKEIVKDCTARLGTSELYIHTNSDQYSYLYCCRLHPLKNPFFGRKKINNY